MREIKFRAWDKVLKKMYYDVQFNSTGRGIVDWDLGLMLQHPDIFKCEQYTGLKDKNGTEIYEGDILRNVWERSDGSIIHDRMGPVVYGDHQTDNDYYNCYVTGYYVDFPKEEYHLFNILGSIEVIGNIHENPELLK